MYITSVPNRKSPPAVLLRESYREDGVVKNRTLSNLSHLPERIIELIRRALKGESFISLDEHFDKVNSWHHGHVDAVLRAMKKLDFASLISSRPGPQRDLVLAMVAGRILEPDTERNSKLANPRWWQTTTLPSLFNVVGANEDDLYDAMDWLLDRQETIEAKLARRHLVHDGLVLYDLTSSYFEGDTCPLAELGHNRDGKEGKLQVNYGLMTDDRGCPIAVSVFPGSTADCKTVKLQTDKLKERFKLKTLVLVGDRGMITQKLIHEDLRNLEGIDWISALKSGAIRTLVANAQLQLELFDQYSLFEVLSPDFPDERLVACRNPALARRRANKRSALLEATAEKLRETQTLIKGGKLQGKDKIERRLEGVVKDFKVSKHFRFEVQDDGFEIQCADTAQAADAALCGFEREIQTLRSLRRRGKLTDKEKLGKRVREVLAKYGVAGHVTIEISDRALGVRLDDPEMAKTAALQAVYQKLDRVRILVQQGKYGGKDAIGIRVGKVVNQYKVAKHFELLIRDDGFEYHIDQGKVTAEAALDGVYVVRTSLAAERMSADNTVRSYKSLSQVERALCWPTTWSGTCEKSGARCSLQTKSRKQKNPETRWPRQRAPRRPSKRRSPNALRTEAKSTASTRCSNC